jgi:hypothetical protein
VSRSHRATSNTRLWPCRHRRRARAGRRLPRICRDSESTRKSITDEFTHVGNPSGSESGTAVVDCAFAARKCQAPTSVTSESGRAVQATSLVVRAIRRRGGPSGVDSRRSATLVSSVAQAEGSANAGLLWHLGSLSGSKRCRASLSLSAQRRVSSPFVEHASAGP